MNCAARDVFKHIEGSKGREYLIKMSAIEIYNEVVHDLLDESKTNLKIQDDPERGPVVDGLSDEPVKSEGHLERLIGTVDKRRYVRLQPASQLHACPAVYSPQEAVRMPRPCPASGMQARVWGDVLATQWVCVRAGAGDAHEPEQQPLAPHRAPVRGEQACRQGHRCATQRGSQAHGEREGRGREREAASQHGKQTT